MFFSISMFFLSIVLYSQQSFWREQKDGNEKERLYARQFSGEQANYRFYTLNKAAFYDALSRVPQHGKSVKGFSMVFPCDRDGSTKFFKFMKLKPSHQPYQ